VNKPTTEALINEVRSVAQNDYMIDGHYLYAGGILMHCADRLEELLKELDK